MKHVEFKNASDHAIKVPDLGIDCGPGKLCHVPLAYARVRHGHSGTAMPSVISLLAPGLVPVDPSEVGGEYGTVEAPKARMPTVRDLVAAGVPEGVAEQLVAAAIASADAAKAQADAPKKDAPKDAGDKPKQVGGGKRD